MLKLPTSRKWRLAVESMRRKGWLPRTALGAQKARLRDVAVQLERLSGAPNGRANRNQARNWAVEQALFLGAR